MTVTTESVMDRIEHHALAVMILGFILLVLMGGAYLYMRDAQNRHTERLACIEAGGTLTSVGGSEPLCLHIETGM